MRLPFHRYWFSLPENYNYQVRWHGIYGVSIGRWFLGAVRSGDFAQPPANRIVDQALPEMRRGKAGQ